MLFKFLRRMKITGIVETEIGKVPLTDFGKPIRYSVKVVAYYPKQFETLEDKLSKLFDSLGSCS
jgi:hypothetical protein